jgi:hypothetical protein
MSDTPSYIRLPYALSDRPLAVIPPSLDDDQFAAQQVEFIKHVFGYCAYLREHSRETPVSDAFLSVFVNLFDAMDANAPGDARRCAGQFLKILRVVVPEFDIEARPQPATRWPPGLDAQEREKS